MLALVLAGCLEVRGGGWIPSAAQDGTKATFGFTGKCRSSELFPDAKGLYEGQLEWDDHSAGVRFHGDVDPGVFIAAASCEDAAAVLDAAFGGGTGRMSELNGEYRPQPDGAPGQFRVTVTDNGEPGINGDTLTIILFGGKYADYTNTGTIQGGNIQVD